MRARRSQQGRGNRARYGSCSSVVPHRTAYMGCGRLLTACDPAAGAPVPGSHWAMVSASTGRVTPGSCVGPRASSDVFMSARFRRLLRGGVLRVWRDMHYPVQVGVGGYRPGPDLRTLQGGVRVRLGAHEVLPDGGFPVFDAVPAGDVDHRVRSTRVERTMQTGAAEAPGTAGNGDVAFPVGDEGVDHFGGHRKEVDQNEGFGHGDTPKLV